MIMGKSIVGHATARKLQEFVKKSVVLTGVTWTKAPSVIL